MHSVNPFFLRDSVSSEIYPQPEIGEVFLIRRDSVSAELISSVHGKLAGSGVVFLTNKRIVFHSLSSKSRIDFMGFQLNLRMIHELQFHQPVFGANFLKGVHISEMNHDPWKITFKSGGCGTFLPALSNAIERSRMSSNSSQSLSPPISGKDAEIVAFVDPNDPSVVYTQQSQARAQQPLAE